MEQASPAEDIVSRPDFGRMGRQDKIPRPQRPKPGNIIRTTKPPPCRNRQRFQNEKDQTPTNGPKQISSQAAGPHAGTNCTTRPEDRIRNRERNPPHSRPHKPRTFCTLHGHHTVATHLALSHRPALRPEHSGLTPPCLSHTARPPYGCQHYDPSRRRPVLRPDTQARPPQTDRQTDRQLSPDK